MGSSIHRLAATWLALGVIAAATAQTPTPAAPAALKPPPTPRKPVTDILHGRKIVDPYRWLEDGDSPEVQRWTEAQNAYTRAYLDAFKPQREALRKRLVALYDAPTLSEPRVVGGRLFYMRQGRGAKQPILYVKTSADAAERVVINPNDWSADGTVAIDWWYPSPDGRLIAYGRSSSGNELSTLYLRDVDAAADTALVIPRTRACSVAWDADGQGFHYVQYPAAGQVPAGQEMTTRWVKYHKFGTRVEDDPIVFGRDAPTNTWHDVTNSSDNRYQFISASLDWSKNDLYVRANRRGETFRPVAVGLDGIFEADVLGETLLMRTSYEAPRFRILATSAADPSQGNWKVLIPQQQGVIESMRIIDGKIVLRVLENAYSRLLVFDATGKQIKEISLPTLGTVTAVTGPVDRPELLFTFESFAYPPALFRYDLGTFELTQLEQTPVDVALEKYTTEQVWFASKDGTRVPMFIIRKADVVADGQRPTVLYGYGGFDVNIVPRFRRDLFPWLDAGGVFASANLRGGGEFGAAWHAAGRLDKKQNVFDDMIAAGEKLVALKITDPDHLGILGGSNGGLLVGAVITQRPDLCRAAYCAVPLLDMLRYHKFLIGALWVPEYGSADDAEQFKWLYAYSPYHHVKDGTAYPAVLLTAAESDTRVDPLHARKMAARLQAATSAPYPILLWIERKAGHGAGKPMDKLIDTKVDEWVFFQSQLGMIQRP